jgi:hypothetical protein
MHLDLYTCNAMYRHEAEQTGKLTVSIVKLKKFFVENHRF